MKHTIRILTLLAAMILTAGHVWGTPAINVEVTGGSIEFYSTYSNGALSNQISTAAAGATVYIKATPDALFTPMGMTFNAYASTGSGVAQARTRNGSNTAPGIGQTIEVSPVADQPGIFTFTMPANGTNANIDATFAAKTKETVSYIDTDGNPQQTEAYVLDGTEVTLGESGTTESYTEFWYVCKTDLSYTSLNFPLYCNVNIILADGVEMKVENSTATAINCHGSLGLYGQSTGDTKGELIAKSTYTYGTAIESEGGITISYCIVTAEGAFYGIRAKGSDKDITISGANVTANGDMAIWSENGGVDITGGTVIANGTSFGIRAMGSGKDVTISGANVNVTANGDNAIWSEKGGISITGGTVIANGTFYGIRAKGSDKDITISGANVTANGDNAIWSDGGGVDITGGTVIANGTSFGIRAMRTGKDITISKAEVTATGDMAINSLNGGVSITDVSTVTAEGVSYGIRAQGSKDITISGANVTAKATGTNGEAISTDNGRVSITGGTVTAEGVSYGIRTWGSDKDITISKAEVTATGDEAIYSVDGSVSITDARTVTANGTSYGINANNGVTISGSEVTATGDQAIFSIGGSVSITGGKVTADGTSYGINAYNYDVTISGSEVTATGDQAIYSQGGGVSITDASTITADGTSNGIKAYGVTISGSKVKAITGGTVTANGTSYGINANNGVTISGSEVTATGDQAICSIGGGVSITDASTITADGTSYGINASYGVTISGSEVTATGDQAFYSVGGSVSITDASTVTADGTSNGIEAKGVTISGSKVIATSGENGSGIKGYGDIVLGWTNSTDFIMASSYKADYGKVTTADGKRFMAYTVDNTNPQSPVENPAAIISGTVSDLTTIASKMLRPLEDYYVSIPSGLSIDDKTPTFTSGSTSYYKTAENAEVTIKVGSYDQEGIELIGTNLPANITFNDNYTQATFTMTAAYVAITDIRYYTTKVAYVDADGNQATTPAADGETPATKVYILTGTETTIGETGKETWYISNTTGDGIGYNDWIKTKGTVHLILADGSKMTVNGNLTFEGETISNSALSASGPLTIYGQSNGTGTLNAITGSGAAIHVPDHALTICGGVVNVEANTAFNGKSLIIYGGEFTTKAEEGTTNNTSISATNVQINDGKVNIGGAIQSAGNATQDIQIHGGQVSVSGSISSGADIILGWTSATDFIKASSYNVDTSKDHYVKIADGKVLKYTDTDDESTVKLLHTGIVPASVINGKELTPYGIFGYCGQDNSETTDVDESKNVTWSIPVDDPATEDIDESKTITISGTGYMMYYNSIQNADESWSNGAPWNAFANQIEAVVIEKGITYVGSNTFAHCPNIKSITLPAEGIYEIGPGAFADCTCLTSIDIPMSVNKIGDGAFAGCSNLATVSIGYGEATSFTIGTEVFPATTTILVPETALSGYQTAKGWSTYQIAPATRTLFAAVSTKLWMTWCDKYAYVKPKGVTVYTVSSVTTDKVTLAEVSGDVIPAYTPVLLYRAAAGEAAVTATFSAVGTAPASGYDAANGICSQSNQAGTFTFFGATTAMAKIPDNDFTYYNGGLTYVLYGDKFLKTDSNNGIAANRCWLKLDAEGGTGPVNARQLVIVVDDETTAVESEKVTVNNEKFAAATVWYTLDGRKLSGKPTKKGLYIYNGKKTVVK